MTAPQPENDTVEPVETPVETVEPETPEASPEDELPEWVKAKINKANREAKGLRDRLKEQEPMVRAAQEAEEATKSEAQKAIERAERAEAYAAQRDTELLAARYGISEDYLEFIGSGTFEEKEARAVKVGQMVQSAREEPAEPNRPPSERPVASLKPGASPTPPPVEDHSYPASWGFQPARDS